MYMNYPCTKGCQKVFFSEESRMKHENYIDCPNVCFDLNISPTQASPSQTTMSEVTLYDLISPSTSEINGMTWDPNLVQFQDVIEEVEVTTENKPANIEQQNYFIRSAHDIVNCPSLSNYQFHEIGKTMDLNKSSKNNRCYEDDFQRLILNVQPETRTEECIQESCTQKTLSEVNLKSEDPFGSLLLFDDEKNDDETYGNEIENIANTTSPELFDKLVDLLFPERQLPIQDTTVSGSQKPEEDFIFSDKKIDSLLDTEMTFMDQYGLPPITFSTGCQPVLENLQMGSYVKGNDEPAFVETTDLVQPVTQEQKKRGRPRKTKIKADVLQNDKPEVSQFNSYVNYPILPDRRCKEASKQNIKRAISEASDSDSSDQEYPLVGAKGSRKRKVSTKYEDEDFDYDEVTDSTDSLSQISVTHTLTEDEHQQKRKKNNAASKKSRVKRKEKDKETEAECLELQKRNNYLTVRAQKLQEAVEKIWEFLAAAKVGNAGARGGNAEVVRVV